MPGHCATPGSRAPDVVEVGGRCTRVGRLTSPLFAGTLFEMPSVVPVRSLAGSRAGGRASSYPSARREGRLVPRRRAEDRGARTVRRAGVFQARDERQLAEVVEALLTEGE